MKVDAPSYRPDAPAPSGMARFAAGISVLAVAVVFGACSAVLALLGVGVPFLLAATGVAGLAGLALFAALRARVLRPIELLARGGAGSLPPELDAISRELQEARDRRTRLQELDASASALRHDLRGALSPALMMADRLAAHDDPAVQRAGEIVGRSIDRATALIAPTRRDPAPEPAASQQAL